MRTHIECFVYGKIGVAEIPKHPELRKLFDNHHNTIDVTIGDKLLFCPCNSSNSLLFAGSVSGFDICGDHNSIETDGNTSISVGSCGYIAKLPSKNKGE